MGEEVLAAVVSPALATAVPAKPPLTIPEIIEQLGWGAGQIVTMTMAGGVFFAEGLEILLMSVLMSFICADLDMQGTTGGFIISSFLAGALVGNVLLGPVADMGGRQFPIIFAHAIVIAVGVVGSFMSRLFTLSICHFIMGLGLGMGQPAALALLNEVTPMRWRLMSTACSSLFYFAGAFLAILLMTIQDPWLNSTSSVEWRLLLRFALLPVGVMGLLSIFFLQESPVWLAAIGDFAQARDALHWLQRKNNKPEVVVNFQSLPAGKQSSQLSWLKHLGSVMSRDLLPAALSLGTISFVLNFALYGSGYVAVQVLQMIRPTSHVLEIAPTAVLLLALLVSTVVVLMGVWLGALVHSKTGIISCLVVAIVAALLFVLTGASGSVGFWPQLVLVISCVGLCLGPTFGILFLIDVSAALFPTVTSATSVAGCLSVGRAGAIAAPLVADWLGASTGHWQSFFVLMAAMEVLCALLIGPIDLAKLRHVVRDPMIEGEDFEANKD